MEAYCYSRPDPDALGLAESFDSCVKRSHAALLRCELESTLAQIDSSDPFQAFTSREKGGTMTQSGPDPDLEPVIAQKQLAQRGRANATALPSLLQGADDFVAAAQRHRWRTTMSQAKPSDSSRWPTRDPIGCETAPESVHQWSLASDNLADKTVQLLRQRFRG